MKNGLLHYNVNVCCLHKEKKILYLTLEHCTRSKNNKKYHDFVEIAI